MRDRFLTVLLACAAAASAVIIAGAPPAAADCSPIACGQTLAGTLAVVGQTDCYMFDADANETVTITTRETAGVFQACWSLTGPGGSLGTTCGQAPRTLPLAGTYTVTVFDANNDQTGAYDLNMVFVSDTALNPRYCSSKR